MSYMKWFFSLLLALILWNCDKSDSNSDRNVQPVPNRPHEKIEAHIDSKKTLVVSITIPPAHHAYLDRGKEGYLVPISFQWKEFLGSGMLKREPRLKSAPAGTYDKEVQATVMRGTGLFIFEIRDSNWPIGKSFNVRSQICNEILGQCYPPAIQQIILK